MNGRRTQLLRNIGATSLITTASRIAGYFRDVVLAYTLGASSSMDAFTIAFRLANLFRRLVAEGSMSACLVPVFIELKSRHDEHRLWSFAGRFFWTLAVFLFLLALVQIWIAPWLVKTMAPGFLNIPGKLDLTIALNRIMAPYLFFIGLSAAAMAILNAFEIFALPASTPIVLNLSIISVMLLFARDVREAAFIASIGVLVGGILQLAIQIPSLLKLGMRFMPRISFKDPAIRKIGILLVPGLFGIGVTQLNLLIDSFFSSFLEEGSVASLYYSDRIMELALGIFGVSIATVILPRLSQAKVERKPEDIQKVIAFSFRFLAFFTIPASVGLIILRREIIQVLFQYGRFASADTERTAFALLFFSLGLFFIASVKIMVPAFYSHQDTKTPVKAALISLGVNLLLNLALIKPLGVGGIALATTTASMVNLAYLILKFHRRILPFPLLDMFKPTAKILAASCGMGLLVWLLTGSFPLDGRSSKSEQGILLLGVIAAGMLSYFLLGLLLGVKEMDYFKTLFSGKKKRAIVVGEIEEE